MTWRLIRSALGTCNWARQLIFRIYSWTEKEALVQQVEVLKAQLQKENKHRFFQAQKITELSTNLELEMKENKTLWNQVEYLTNELHIAKTWKWQQSNLLSEGSVLKSRY